MRLGVLPGQQRELRRAFKKAKAFDTFRRRTRRQFIALGLLGVAGSAVAFVAGRRTVPAVRAASTGPWHARLPWARAFAREPIETMVQGASTFLGVLQNAGQEDPVLWQGFARLAEHALSRHDERAAVLRSRLLLVCDAVPPLPEWVPVVERLRAGR